MKKYLSLLLVVLVLISMIVLASCGLDGKRTTTTTTTQKEEPVDPPVHVHTEVIDEAVGATCTSTGLTEGKHCSECGEVLVAQQETPCIAHTYDNKYDDTCNECGHVRDAECAHTETEVIEGKDATCTEIGYTDGEKCKKCGEIITEQIVIPMLEHSYSSVVTAPTCTEKGYTTYTCGCGDSYIDDYTDALDHDYETVVTDPTCTEKGYTTYTCGCGDSFINDYVDATGHSFGEWVTVKEATTTEEGLQERTCDCGEKETQIIDKLEVQGSVGLEFKLNSDGLSYGVVGIGTCEDKDIIIPNAYNNLPVTTIKSDSFSNRYHITSITIPESITSIDFPAFWYCASLTEFIVSEDNPNYTSIDGNLYSKDKKTLIQYAIGKKESSFTIPDFVTHIGGCGAFAWDRSLESVYIPDTVISIADSSFEHCESLKSITIPDSVIFMGDYAFFVCRSLTSVKIGNGITNIGNSAFRACTSLVDIDFGDNVTTIGTIAFVECTSLKEIEFSKNITTIGDCAFEICTSLTSITIGEGVELIYHGAFYKCTALTSIKYNGTIEQWNSIILGADWDYNTRDYTIYCTDGTIKKDGSITYK